MRTLALNLSEAARTALTEPYRLTIEHHQIYLKRLPPAFDGFRIVQLSDIHHSPFTSRAQIERAVDTANSLQPDIVALTGDYISKERQYAAPCAELLGKLRARHGVFAVLGNHDHWTDAALITDLFRAEGMNLRLSLFRSLLISLALLNIQDIAVITNSQALIMQTTDTISEKGKSFGTR